MDDTKRVAARVFDRNRCESKCGFSSFLEKVKSMEGAGIMKSQDSRSRWKLISMAFVS